MSSDTRKICIDMDDVLNDFTLHVLHHVIDKRIQVRDWLRYNTEWGFDIVLAANQLNPEGRNISSDDFWKAVTREIWASAPVSSVACQLFNMCIAHVGIENVCILTAPRPEICCFLGKKDWIDNYFSSMKDNVIYAKRKEFLACPNSLLIDDKEENVDKFREAGGKAFLVPRPWNRKHAIHDYDNHTIGFLSEKLESWR